MKKNKLIIVQWVEAEFPYGKEMRVFKSNHKKYKVGSRFDYGFFDVATNEGYSIVSIPMQKKTRKKKKS